MNGPIAQLVALALHGNAFLSGISSAQFLSQNSTAQFCESIRFVRVEKSWLGLSKPQEVQIADSPDAWFTYLRREHAEQLSVRWQTGTNPEVPDRMLAGFVGGGGTWMLVVRFADGRCERWLARWDIGDKDRNDRKIWRVTYGCVLVKREPPSLAVSSTEATARLKKALFDIHAFSAKHQCEGFTQSFERGLKALAHEPGAEGYHRDLYPGREIASVSDLLVACQHGWVFGGMGSWNDMGFDGADGQEYNRVSEQLYGAIITAIPAAVDEYAAGVQK
jgi:hypothetical protein